MTSSIRSVIRGVGSYLPAKTVTNEELAKTVDTSDEWIQQRVGIKERHIAAEGEFTSDLAAAAARAALDNAGFAVEDIDLIIVATTTPDYTFPSAATLVQMKLGMHHGFAFDIQAVCSGFVYAVATADSYIKNGMARRVLVIGAETFSRLLDWTDRTTCVLFGDGAGAVVMERVDLAEGEPERGVLTSALRSDGRHWDKLYVDGGPSTTGTTGHVHMQGPEVFRHAVGKIYRYGVWNGVAPSPLRSRRRSIFCSRPMTGETSTRRCWPTRRTMAPSRSTCRRSVRTRPASWCVRATMCSSISRTTRS